MIAINYEDGRISIRNGTASYHDTLENFQLDSGHQLPDPPEGVHTIRYDPKDGRLLVFSGDSQAEYKHTAFKERLEQAYGATASLFQKQAERTAPKPKPERAKKAYPPPGEPLMDIINRLQADVASLRKELADMRAKK